MTEARRSDILRYLPLVGAIGIIVTVALSWSDNKNAGIANAGAIDDIEVSLRATIEDYDVLDDTVEAIRRARIQAAGDVRLKLDRIQTQVEALSRQGEDQKQLLRSILARLPVQ